MRAEPAELNGLDESERDEMDKRVENAHASLAAKGLMRLHGVVVLIVGLVGLIGRHLQQEQWTPQF